MSSSRVAGSAFEWRVATGRWRWLLLGGLSVAANACWGKADEDGGGTAPGGAGSGAIAGASRCSNPTPLGAGWERCSNGLMHRAAIAEQCGSALPRAQGIAPDVLARLYPGYVAGAGGSGSEDVFARPQCERDSDCTQRPFGYCNAGSYGDGATGVFCAYGCVSDADCGSNQVCLCGDAVGECFASTCSTDADCEGDRMCASFDADPGCPNLQFACQTPRDKCATNADCPDQQTCTRDEFSSNDVRHCSKDIYTCGRPFLIDGAARLADVEERSDWYPVLQGSGSAAPLPGAAPLLADAQLRAAVAQGWLNQALMEHASVAAFARFSLQLLSLGAPAEMVRQSARALEDEIGHARDCFALARRHGEREVGPGPLPLAGALDGQDLRAIVLGTIAEGCIGESLAALEAAEARAHCTDAPARAVLERIAVDETRHAQLAWRFVAWALETGPASLRADVREAFARELSARAASAPAVASDFEQRLLRQGVMSAGLRAALRRRVLAELIAPCAEALLQEGLSRREGLAASRSASNSSEVTEQPVLTGAPALC